VVAGSGGGKYCGADGLGCAEGPDCADGLGCADGRAAHWVGAASGIAVWVPVPRNARVAARPRAPALP